MNKIWNPIERDHILGMLAYAFIGGPEKLSRELQEFADETGIDEVMATSHIFDHPARLKSYRLFAEAVHKSSFAKV